MDFPKSLRTAIEGLVHDDELIYSLVCHRAETELLSKIAYKLHKENPGLIIVLDETTISPGDRVDMVCMNESEREICVFECKLLNLEKQYESFLIKAPKVFEDSVAKLRKIQLQKQLHNEVKFYFISGLALLHFDNIGFIEEKGVYYAEDHNAFVMAGKKVETARTKIEQKFKEYYLKEKKKHATELDLGVYKNIPMKLLFMITEL
jgi:hypothetical protein